MLGSQTDSPEVGHRQCDGAPFERETTFQRCLLPLSPLKSASSQSRTASLTAPGREFAPRGRELDATSQMTS